MADRLAAVQVLAGATPAVLAEITPDGKAGTPEERALQGPVAAAVAQWAITAAATVTAAAAAALVLEALQVLVQRSRMEHCSRRRRLPTAEPVPPVAVVVEVVLAARAATVAHALETGSAAVPAVAAAAVALVVLVAPLVRPAADPSLSIVTTPRSPSMLVRLWWPPRVQTAVTVPSAKPAEPAAKVELAERVTAPAAAQTVALGKLQVQTVVRPRRVDLPGTMAATETGAATALAVAAALAAPVVVAEMVASAVAVRADHQSPCSTRAPEPSRSAETSPRKSPSEPQVRAERHPAATLVRPEPQQNNSMCRRSP